MFKKDFYAKFDNKNEIKEFCEIVEKLEEQNYFVSSDFSILENCCYLIDEFYSKLKEKIRYLTITKKQMVENEIAVLELKIEQLKVLKSKSKNDLDETKIEIEIKTYENEIYKLKESLEYKYFKFNKNGEFVENHDFKMKEQIKPISDILEKSGLSPVVRTKLESLIQNRGTRSDDLLSTITKMLEDDETRDNLKKN